MSYVIPTAIICVTAPLLASIMLQNKKPELLTLLLFGLVVALFLVMNDAEMFAILLLGVIGYIMIWFGGNYLGLLRFRDGVHNWPTSTSYKTLILIPLWVLPLSIIYVAAIITGYHIIKKYNKP